MIKRIMLLTLSFCFIGCFSFAQAKTSYSCPATQLTHCFDVAGPLHQCNGTFILNGKKTTILIQGSTFLSWDKSLPKGKPDAGLICKAADGKPCCLYMNQYTGEQHWN